MTSIVVNVFCSRVFRTVQGVITRQKASTGVKANATLRMMRDVVAPQLAEVYPQFAAQVFGTPSPLSDASIRG